MILHIDPEKVWQGGQRQVAYLVKGLQNNGIKSAVACRRNSPLEKYCREKGWQHIPLKLHKPFNFIAVMQMLNFCRKNQVKLIHCHSSLGLTLGLQLKFFLPRLKLTASRRVDFHIGGRFSLFFKYNSPFLDKLICISENIKKVCESDGILSSKLKVIHSGIEIDRLTNEKPPADFLVKEGLPEHNLVIGTIAALVHHKDYPTLLEAARKTLKKHPQVLFLSLGKGFLHRELVEKAKDIGIEKRFLFLGFRQEIGWFLNSFDIFTLASKFEGLGTSVLDALACGKPCVCTNGGGIPEMIRDGENGLLVPARQPENLAEAFSRLIENPQLREQLGKAARDSVKKFSIENTVQAHIELYEELLHGGL